MTCRFSNFPILCWTSILISCLNLKYFDFWNDGENQNTPAPEHFIFDTLERSVLCSSFVVDIIEEKNCHCNHTYLAITLFSNTLTRILAL